MPRIVQYPDDLGTRPDLQHYVLFMINIRTSRTSGITRFGAVGTPFEVTPGGAGGPAQGVIAGAFVGAGAAAAVGTTESNTMRRLDTAIALHIQDPPASQYSAKYENVDLLGMGQVGNLLGGTGSIFGAAGKEFAAAMGTNMASTVAKGFSNPAGLSALTKLRVNPFKQTYFEEMDFRKFLFRYTFMPKTLQEAIDVKNIIDLFKYHMHPELSAESAFLIFPSEFDIMYFYGPDENTYWHRISTCVLEDLQVIYGGEMFQTFPQGIPSEIQLNLQFRETEVLNKERIAMGY